VGRSISQSEEEMELKGSGGGGGRKQRYHKKDYYKPLWFIDDPRSELKGRLFSSVAKGGGCRRILAA